jgi:cadmium resistance protein CadD (predicted permease)
MATLPNAIADAAVLFAGTNVDDLAVLAVLSASSRAAGSPRRAAWLVPAVYLLVAVYIFWKTGAFSRLQ